MLNSTIEFSVKKENGVITKIGKSAIYIPRTNFKSGNIKWYEDKLKAGGCRKG